MSGVIQNNMKKVKIGLDSYLQNNRISPFLDIIEEKIHLERSFVVFSMLLQFFFAFCNVLFT
jgi:hypothetical protein